MQPGERELHLGLNARRSREATSCRALRQVFQQRGLPEPRLAAQDQHLTLTRPHSDQQPIKRRALSATTGQHSSHVPAREESHRNASIDLAFARRALAILRQSKEPTGFDR